MTNGRKGGQESHLLGIMCKTCQCLCILMNSGSISVMEGKHFSPIKGECINLHKACLEETQENDGFSQWWIQARPPPHSPAWQNIWAPEWHLGPVGILLLGSWPGATGVPWMQWFSCYLFRLLGNGSVPWQEISVVEWEMHQHDFHLLNEWRVFSRLALNQILFLHNHLWIQQRGRTLWLWVEQKETKSWK